MSKKSFQDYYPDSLSHCYGCGALNEKGLQIQSYWDGDESIARFSPKDYHLAFPGYVYGGLIASLIDCHCVGTAAAAAYRHEERAPGTKPSFRYVTASLQVDYIKPTPLGPQIEIRAAVEEIKGKKTIITATVKAGPEISARGRVVAVRIPDHLLPDE
ncbi:MAG: PaaI family thioesterase [Desulfobacterales bacterium]|nr:PaaI family thioesterase [Deltaproteobacteria bacterium]NNK93223.1 PaaI family thioesterase [Desulfobacterales bacterium]